MKTLFAALAVLTAAPAFAGDVKAEITARIEAWAKAFNAHDAKALAAGYADDARYVYAFEGQEGGGKTNVEAFYVQSFKATPDVAVKLVRYDVIKLSATLAVGLGEWEDSLTGPDGKKMVLPVHSSEVWVKAGGTWKVKVDHASFVPPPQPPPPEKPQEPKK